ALAVAPVGTEVRITSWLRPLMIVPHPAVRDAMMAALVIATTRRSRVGGRRLLTEPPAAPHLRPVREPEGLHGHLPHMIDRDLRRVGEHEDIRVGGVDGGLLEQGAVAKVHEPFPALEPH